MKKIRLFIILLVLGLASRPILSQEVPEEDVEVTVGIDRVEKLDFTPSTKVEVGNETILSYTLIPDDTIREITLKGLKPGKTSVIIRNNKGEIKKRYRVDITSNDQSKTVIKLREFLNDVEGITISIKGGSVVVEGDIIVPRQIGKLAVVLRREEFKDVIVLVELSPQTQRIIARKMQQEIQNNVGKEVTVFVVPGEDIREIY